MFRILRCSVRTYCSVKTFHSVSTQARLVSSSHGTSTPILQEANLNPKLLQSVYAVRGELVAKALEYKEMLQNKDHNLPFKEIIYCNIGNPQELGQLPITFFRQVLSLCQYPQMISYPKINDIFARDAIRRAQFYLKNISGMGAYTISQGIPEVRKDVASFIAKRDSYPCDFQDIFLTDGASSAIKMILNAVVRTSRDAIMIPIPQYPLYSATLTLLGATQAYYFLDEENRWELRISELVKSVYEARKKGLNVRGLVVINPGNPTGQCLSTKNMEEIVDFCYKERILILADEVYQTNIYGSTPFTSFKKVVRSMGPKYSNFELISFHSVSKGVLGECGQRGGYMELVGIDPLVKAQILKMASIGLCSNTSGQIMTGLMTNPPKPGDESYQLYKQEIDSIFQSLQRRARKLVDILNKIPGIKCNDVEGAMYAFPQISLPTKFVEAAREANKHPDTFYALRLLDNTGIVVVPGSGFGQNPGTYHFRTTILPPEDKFDSLLQTFRDFHIQLMNQYS